MGTVVIRHVMWEDNYKIREDRVGEDVVEKDREREDMVAEDWRVEDWTQGEWNSLQKVLRRKSFLSGNDQITLTNNCCFTTVSTLLQIYLQLYK